MNENKEIKLANKARERQKVTNEALKIIWSKQDMRAMKNGNKNRVKNKLARKERQKQRRMKKGLRKIA